MKRKSYEKGRKDRQLKQFSVTHQAKRLRAGKRAQSVKVLA